jgi:single-strand DNA-binding protein
MLNQVVLVGRLTDDPKVEESENGTKYSTIVLAVQRTFKNSEGIYEADFIRCRLWNAIANSTSEYCHKGDIVGIKGRIKVSNYDDEDGNKKYMTEVIAEKVTFLTSKKEEEKEEK